MKQFEIQVHTIDGEKFASVRHVASDCGADFCESGESFNWQDNNGLLANCDYSIIAEARKIADEALTQNQNQNKAKP